MQSFVGSFKRLVFDESGASAVEYGLLAALIAGASIVAFSTLGAGLIDLFDAVSLTIGNAMKNAAAALSS